MSKNRLSGETHSTCFLSIPGKVSEPMSEPELFINPYRNGPVFGKSGRPFGPIFFGAFISSL
jgi:hypothetical protein